MTIPRRHRRTRFSAWTTACVLALGLTAGCSDEKPQHSPQQFGHVHGLGVNPADQTLYAATHAGVFAIKGGSAHLIANRRQDTMGFTVAGPDEFLASGHPASMNKPNPLGLIKSDDAARTWSAVDFAGERDFHAIDVAGPRVYAYSADTGTLVRSHTDGSWKTVARVGLLDIAVDPNEPDRVLATSYEGDLVSYRVGSAPVAMDEAPVLGIVDWSPGGDLVGAGRAGKIWVSRDAGKTWRPRGDIPGTVEALTVKTATWYAATSDGIYQSLDRGHTWTGVLR